MSNSNEFEKLEQLEYDLMRVKLDISDIKKTVTNVKESVNKIENNISELLELIKYAPNGEIYKQAKSHFETIKNNDI